MKRSIIFILLIVPILLFSQENSIVWESIYKQDTIVSMYKNHAKRLAGERVEYWYLKEVVQLKDSLNESYKNRLSTASLLIDKYKEREENYQNQLDMYGVLVESYKEEVGTLINEVDSLKKKEFWIVLSAVISIVGLGVVFN